MSYYLNDFEHWIPIVKEKPELNELVEITDADVYGYADFVYECYLSDDGYFYGKYNKDGAMKIAAYTITYWKPISKVTGNPPE